MKPTSGTEQIETGAQLSKPAQAAPPTNVMLPSGHQAWRRLAGIALLSLAIASGADYILARWLGLLRFTPIYRRVGPETGPQVFVGGSSLTVWGLSWAEVSKGLGEGIETWGVGGSSPDIWEVWQQDRPLSNITIIGVSVYDLNEMHLAEARANSVPLSRTIGDLWASSASSDLSGRILTQYALKYERLVFPTADRGNRVLEGLRSEAAGMIGLQKKLEEHEGVVVEPEPPILGGGETTANLTEWPPARLLRRIAILQEENHGLHDFFHGPKRMALLRMLNQARQHGEVIVVVFPVSQNYAEAFLNPSVAAAFETAIADAAAIVPEATIVRVDRLPGISSPNNFYDLVHMNSFGRKIATEAFLKAVGNRGLTKTNKVTLGASMAAAK